MASRKLIVQIVGDDDSLRRAFKRSSTGAASFDRSISRATRGALAGSGVFRSLGRSIAFASGGFLAFASAGQFLRTSIDAAKEAGVVQAQLGAQFRASGKDLAKYQGAIDKTANRLSLLAGFENDELKSAFVTIFRASGNVSKSLRDTGLAADIARAKHIDLSKAAQLVAKVEAGNIGILRRQGVQVAKNATVEQALTIARLKFLGQARAGTTEQERFGAVLHNTEEIIGIGLLPTLNKYLARASVWLTQMNESGKLQKDVARITKDAGIVLHDAGVFARFFADRLRDLNRVTGDSEHSIALLSGAFLLLKQNSSLRWALIQSGIVRTGGAAAVAAGEVGGLRGALTGLGSINPIVIPITLLLTTKQGRDISHEQVSNLQNLLRDPLPTDKKKLGDLAHDIGKVLFGGKPTADSLIGRLFGVGKDKQGSSKLLPFPLAPFKLPAAPAGPGGQKAGARPLSLQGQFNLAELALQRAALTEATADDRRALVVQAAITREQLAQTKTLKDRISKTQQLAGILSQIRGIDSDIAAKAKAAADAAKERAKAAREVRESFTVPLRLQLAAAKASSTVATADDLNVARKIRSAARKALRSGRLALQGQIDAWNTIAGVNDQLRNAATGAVTKFQKLDTSKFIKGLGLDIAPADVRKLRAGLSQIGPGGTVPRGSVGAAGAGGSRTPVVVHSHVYIDGKQIAPVVTRHQQKTAKRNPGQRRGPHAGQ